MSVKTLAFRSLTVACALAGLVAATAPSATASTGFRVAGRETTRAVLGARDRTPAGLYCASPVIKRGAYDSLGVVRLRRSARARVVKSGNDLLLAIDGVRPGASERLFPRPRLRLHKRWRRQGFVCRNRASGLVCRDGAHGFVLTRMRARYF